MQAEVWSSAAECVLVTRNLLSEIGEEQARHWKVDCQMVPPTQRSRMVRLPSLNAEMYVILRNWSCLAAFCTWKCSHRLGGPSVKTTDLGNKETRGVVYLAATPLLQNK